MYTLCKHAGTKVRNTILWEVNNKNVLLLRTVLNKESGLIEFDRFVSRSCHSFLFRSFLIKSITVTVSFPNIKPDQLLGFESLSNIKNNANPSS